MRYYILDLNVEFGYQNIITRRILLAELLLIQKNKNYIEFLGYRFKPFQTCSEVVQGSNLGPLLLLFFFNDVFSIFKSHYVGTGMR